MEKSGDKLAFIVQAIQDYKSSKEYRLAIEAEAYFKGENIAIANRPKWTMRKSGRKISFSKNIAVSNFFFRFIVQQNQFLLANGLQTKDQSIKDRLGFGFDKTLEAIGEKSLVHGACWGYWNHDKLEKFEIASIDKLRGFYPLLDELTGEPMAAIRFWQLESDRPMIIEFYEIDGHTTFINKDDLSSLEIYKPKESYKTLMYRDSISEKILGTENYKFLPIVPLYANEYHRSEFTPSIKTKIDMYDKISSDFGDNLERANDILWVFNNFGGNEENVREALSEINELGAVFNTNEANAMPHTIEVPYTARQVALDILERALYSDFMAMNMTDITGGSLTNVAIQTATANMEMKVNRYEWQVFTFCQKIFALNGIETEDIKFRRQQIANETENIENVVKIYEAELFDKQTALEKLPNVGMDEVETILHRLDIMEQNTADRTFSLDIDESIED